MEVKLDYVKSINLKFTDLLFSSICQDKIVKSKSFSSNIERPANQINKLSNLDNWIGSIKVDVTGPQVP